MTGGSKQRSSNMIKLGKVSKETKGVKSVFPGEIAGALMYPV